MKRTAAVRPESPELTTTTTSTMEQQAPTPLKLPPLNPGQNGGPNDFSLPSPKGNLELPGMSQTIAIETDYESKDPYPLYHLKGRSKIEPVQVDCLRESLNSGDVFVLDMRAHPLYCVVQWTGAEANRREKAAGRLFMDKLHNEVSGLFFSHGKAAGVGGACCVMLHVDNGGDATLMEKRNNSDWPKDFSFASFFF